MSSVPLGVSPMKSQPAFRNVLAVCISAVVLPVPLELVAWPELWVSQKQDATGTQLVPTSPPTDDFPLTAPVL
jgi:hypothetical protein